MTRRFINCLPVVNVLCWNWNHLLGEKFVSSLHLHVHILYNIRIHGMLFGALTVFQILGDHQVAKTPWHRFYRFEGQILFPYVSVFPIKIIWGQRS